MSTRCVNPPPYSKYPAGLESAYKMACDVAAMFAGLKIPVFCPISHTHGVGLARDLPVDSEFWLNFDEPFMYSAVGLIVVKASGWRHSVGVQFEIEHFCERGKPIHFLEFDDEKYSKAHGVTLQDFVNA